MEPNILFESQDIHYELPLQEVVRKWILSIATRYGYTIDQLDFIFVSDEFLLKMNQDYLKHDYYTDIITFPYHPDGGKNIISEIYISVDRVRENAEEHKEAFIDELHRVMIHGVLHMTGFSDKTKAAAAEMRKAENLALSLRMF